MNEQVMRGLAEEPIDGGQAGQGASVASIPLLTAGALIGALADTLLRAEGGGLGLNWLAIVASVAILAVVLHHRVAADEAPMQPARLVWLAIGVAFAAGLVWRASEPLTLVALGGSILAFALAAYRPETSWMRHAGVVRYGVAAAVGAVHTWVGAAMVLLDVGQRFSRVEPGAIRAGNVAAVVRGLVLAAPLLLVFGALFMSADAVFSELIVSVVRFDLEWLLGHVVLFSLFAWWSTGYLRGFLIGTDLSPQRASGRDDALMPEGLTRPRLGIGEVATVLLALDLLFLVFVLVQFRYLFGGDDLVQVTRGLTYAEYARQGFFELVAAVLLVVPVLLLADWLLAPRTSRDGAIFRLLAGAQIILVLTITASALMRLRLYYASYGLTEARFHAAVLLVWLGAMLLWLAATVLRGRRNRFASGALVTGLATAGLLFIVNPDAIVARANVDRLRSVEGPRRFDVTYATTLSADAVPVLIEALPALPSDVRCPLARHLLLRWARPRRSVRNWQLSTEQARFLVREHEPQLRAMVGPDETCARPGVPSGR